MFPNQLVALLRVQTITEKHRGQSSHHIPFDIVFVFDDEDHVKSWEDGWQEVDILQGKDKQAVINVGGVTSSSQHRFAKNSLLLK